MHANMMFQIAFNINVPFYFIALYIAVVATIKRGRALGFFISKTVIYGVLTYLTFPCLYAATLALFYKNRGAPVEMTWMFSIITLVGIATICYISSLKTDEDEAIQEDGYNSVNTLISIGKLKLVYTGLITIWIILVLRDIINPDKPALLIIIWIIYLVSYIYIMVQRGIDAGSKAFTVLAVAIASVVLFVTTWYFITYLYLSPLIMSIIKTSNNLAFQIFCICIFIFIALPSKTTEEEYPD
jgi:hypothetical protein